MEPESPLLASLGGFSFASHQRALHFAHDRRRPALQEDRNPLAERHRFSTILNAASTALNPKLPCLTCPRYSPTRRYSSFQDVLLTAGNHSLLPPQTLNHPEVIYPKLETCLLGGSEKVPNHVGKHRDAHTLCFGTPIWQGIRLWSISISNAVVPSCAIHTSMQECEVCDLCICFCLSAAIVAERQMELQVSSFRTCMWKVCQEYHCPKRLGLSLSALPPVPHTIHSARTVKQDTQRNVKLIGMGKG